MSIPSLPAWENPNDRRAQRGGRAVWSGAAETNTAAVEELQTSVIDTLSDILHFAEAAGMDVGETIEDARLSWLGDAEDGPPAEVVYDATKTMAEHQVWS